MMISNSLTWRFFWVKVRGGRRSCAFTLMPRALLTVIASCDALTWRFFWVEFEVFGNGSSDWVEAGARLMILMERDPQKVGLMLDKMKRMPAGGGWGRQPGRGAVAGAALAIAEQHRLVRVADEEAVLEDVDLGYLVAKLRLQDNALPCRKSLHQHLRERNVRKFELATVAVASDTCIVEVYNAAQRAEREAAPLPA